MTKVPDLGPVPPYLPTYLPTYLGMYVDRGFDSTVSDSPHEGGAVWRMGGKKDDDKADAYEQPRICGIQRENF
jgi:hypothetical protein